MVLLRNVLTVQAVLGLASAAAIPASQIFSRDITPIVYRIDPNSLNLPAYEEPSGRAKAPGKVPCLDCETGTPPPDQNTPTDPPSDPRCLQMYIRRAWDSFTDTEKKAYLDAVVCLMNTPTKTGLPFAQTLHDDFVKMHQTMANYAHNSGWFLPFHRAMLHTYEQTLRNTCAYRGALPYWNEWADAGSFSTASIFDPVYGFGGNGSGEGQCIQDGPFANYTLNTGPGYNNIPHCIWRQFDDYSSTASARQYTERCFELDNYYDFTGCVENGHMPGVARNDLPIEVWRGEVPQWPPVPIDPSQGGGFDIVQALASPHNGGHIGVGGEMGNPISSPGDPLFFLHHAWVDRIWWQWQRKNLTERLTDIGGFSSAHYYPLPDVGHVPATLEDNLNMVGLGPDKKIGDVMDSRQWPLCVEYK
ncbi:Di-copper centre-containing protein [Ascobolus immersus RN42]|uniref:Di-copper centre-containing protein n=1 Tax=Ascobolus immersus RN42 TaxID=1160509 RepID=A0A3N4IFZ1_ASCIM|nr:Di-copper centre-containing protein [Ascobolus immersus RN42]